MTQNLRIPGPTACPEDTLAELSRQMINHRGPEFADMQERIMERLKNFFRTENDVYVYTTSGTGAMEAAIVNTLSPGDNVLGVSIGEFGDRFVEIAKAFGAEVTELAFEPGTAADPQAVAEALAKDPAIKAVLVTHNETSTGVTNDVAGHRQGHPRRQPRSPLHRRRDQQPRLPPLRHRRLGSRRRHHRLAEGLHDPARPRLRHAAAPAPGRPTRRSKMSQVLLDIGKYKSYAERGQPPFTPAVSLYYGLDMALDMMCQEGFEQINARHAAHRRVHAREGARPRPRDPRRRAPRPPNTVTSVVVPEGINAADCSKILNSEYDTVLAAGQGKLTGKIVRIGHMGIVDESDIDAAIDALETALDRLGYKKPAAVQQAPRRHSMARVLVTDRVSRGRHRNLRNEADVDVRLGISPAELLEIIPDYDALVVRSETKVTAEVLDAGTQPRRRRPRRRRRRQHRRRGGDRAAASSSSTRPPRITIATAEHTVGLMLALARHIPAGPRIAQGRRWERSKFVGVELRGKTLGVIGLGRIGSEVARAPAASR